MWRRRGLLPEPTIGGDGGPGTRAYYPAYCRAIVERIIALQEQHFTLDEIREQLRREGLLVFEPGNGD